MRILAFSSKTGSDVIWLHKRLKDHPNHSLKGVVVNNGDSPLIKYAVENNLRLYVLRNNPSPTEYGWNMGDWINHFDVCFLMGWMRIIPRVTCQNLKMYNLHPGDVQKYPELKGKDPQKRAIELCLDYTGCVIHRVTPVVDDGEIVCRRTIPIHPLHTETTLIEELVEVGRALWLELLEKWDDDKISQFSRT